MKVFLSCDMEGTAGIVDWTQCQAGNPGYEHGVALLQAEVNAAITGAVTGGATQVLVNDSHSVMQNLRPELLAGRARYLSGRHKPLYMMQGLDPSFDAVLLVSYHGSMGGPSAVLSHTYSPRAIAEVRLNGTPVGEAGINALVAQAHGVPVVLVTGDDVTATESRAVLPGIRTAVVKTAVSRFAADSLHPHDACELIAAEAEAALRGLAQVRPPAFDLPARLDITFRNADLAEMATWVRGVERTGGCSAALVDDDPLRLYRTFVTVLLLGRGIAE